jgi:hypothetical protein
MTDSAAAATMPTMIPSSGGSPHTFNACALQ